MLMPAYNLNMCCVPIELRTPVLMSQTRLLLVQGDHVPLCPPLMLALHMFLHLFLYTLQVFSFPPISAHYVCSLKPISYYVLNHHHGEAKHVSAHMAYN